MSSRSTRVIVVCAVALASAAPAARAEPLPDASLAALADRAVEIELDDGRSVTGRVLAFDASIVTVAAIGTGEVIPVERAHIRRILVVPPGVDGPTAPTPEPPLRARRWAVQLAIPGTLNVDLDRGYLHAFASGSFLLPLLTAAGEHAWWAFTAGAGIALPVSPRWKLDAFAVAIPIRYTSFYTYVAMGTGLGAHFTGRSGITFGVSIPLVGFAARLGHSPYGYDAPFRYNDSLGYFYFAGFSAMPLVTVGYRFAR